MKKYVAYYRVSTDKQGESGLGLEAQREAVMRHIGDTSPLAEFTEVESGKNKERTELLAAIEMCKRHKARLVIAKLDRLGRDAAHLLHLLGSMEVEAADHPNAPKAFLQLQAVFAEWEAEKISERTRAGLKAAKARGVQLGNPNISEAQKVAAQRNQVAADEYAKSIWPHVQTLRSNGVVGHQKIAEELNCLGFTTRRGGQWSRDTVRRLVKRCGQ